VSIEHIFLWGAGGHGAVVLDALLTSGSAGPQVVVVDSDQNTHGRLLLGFPIVAEPGDEIAGQHFHIAVGRNDVRARLFAKLLAACAMPRSVVHPQAIVSAHSMIDPGSFIAAAAIVAPRVCIAVGCIINHGAVIDHDCKLAAFCHIAPTASLGGNVIVGEAAMIGAGANILPGVEIGSGAVIGAGAVVRRHVPAGATVVGVPARARECG
jgi:sugar O-acyltransferase (sialic acid O-acetyltransferase NeuD family)